MKGVFSEMQVERVVVVSEMLKVSPAVYKAIKELLGEMPIQTVPHQDFKEQPVRPGQ